MTVDVHTEVDIARPRSLPRAFAAMVLLPSSRPAGGVALAQIGLGDLPSRRERQHVDHFDDESVERQGHAARQVGDEFGHTWTTSVDGLDEDNGLRIAVGVDDTHEGRLTYVGMGGQRLLDVTRMPRGAVRDDRSARPYMRFDTVAALDYDNEPALRCLWANRA